MTSSARKRPQRRRIAERRTRRAVEPSYTPLRAGELSRKLVHMAPGLLAFLLPLTPHDDPLALKDRIALIVWSTLITAGVWWVYPKIARPGEKKWFWRIVSYPAAILFNVWAFPDKVELAALVLSVLAFGDGAAALGGQLWGRRRLPWNREKSWAGLISFIAFAVPLGGLAFWLVAEPSVPAAGAFGCALAAVTAGALAESWPSEINDNCRVGIAATAAGILAHWSLI